MDALLEFNSYRIEQRTRYSKVKVYKRTDDIETGIDLEDSFIVKERQAAIKKFFDCNISESLFRFDEELLRVIIPDGVEKVEQMAFNFCSNLNFVIIPDSVTSLESSAFYECIKLKTVVIPDNIKNMGLGVFTNCYELEEVIYKGNVYKSKSKFQDALAKNGVITKHDDMFYNTKLKE